MADFQLIISQQPTKVINTLQQGPAGPPGPTGPAGSAGTIQWNEPVTGTVNGTNPTFTLAHAPNPGTSLMLFVNGLKQQPTNDFTLLGSTITFVSGAIPQTGDHLEASYPF